jgi:predicted ATPase
VFGHWTEHRTPNTEHLLQYPSVALFVDRAGAARPGFRLTPENAAAVAQLCERLEGLPLAIELAAARSRVLMPPQILERLSRRFELLVSWRRDVSARHRTLWAALEWSYQLLSPELQRFFARLSIFRGGWTLEAAEAVCADVDLPRLTFRWGGDLLQSEPPQVDNPAALEHLEQLQQCSLVVAEEAGAGMRYRLLETVREFAAAQLTPEEHTVLARRHLHYYMPLAHETRHKAHEHRAADAQMRRLQDVDREYANLRAALEWALEAEPASALWLAAALAGYWSIRGAWAEALDFLPRAARWQSDPTLEMRAKALRYAGELACEQGDYRRAQAWLEESVATSRRIGHPEILAIAREWEGRAVPDPDVDRMRQMGVAEYVAAGLFNLSEVAAEQGEYDRARDLCQQSLELRRGLWDECLTAAPLAGLGHLALAQGEYEAARSYYEQSRALYHTTGRRREAALRTRDLGIVACHRHDYEKAQECFREALAVLEEYGDRLGVGLVYRSLGDAAMGQAASGTARHCYQETLAIFRQLGHRRGVASALEGLARWAHTEDGPSTVRPPGVAHPPSGGYPLLSPRRAPAGHPGGAGARHAARLLGAAQALREAIGSPLPPNEQPGRDALIAALRQDLGEEFTAAWEAGRALSWEQAAADALEDD